MRSLILIICLLLGLSSSVAAKTTTLEKAVPYLVKKLVPEKPKTRETLAILPLFTLEGETSRFGKFFSEQLLTELHSLGSYKMVDRSLMDKILGEMKLGQSGAFNPDSIKKLGKLLGADLVGTGTYTDLGKRIQINTRLIRTETGVVISAGRVQVKADRSVRQLLNTQLPKKESGVSSGKWVKGTLLWEGSECNGISEGTELENFKGQLTRSCKGGEYFFRTTEKARSWYWRYYGSAYQDFVLEADVRKISGTNKDHFGVSFRIDTDSDSKKYYYATINGAGEYQIVKYLGKRVILRRGHSKFINKGKAKNNLKVVCVGNQIQFYVNGHLLAEVKDSLIELGKLGHYLQAGVSVAYKGNLKVFGIE